MRILLLGPNGQLGHDLARRAASHSPAITIVPVTRQELDVMDVASIPATLDRHTFDALINCASYHKTDEVESNAPHAVAVNAFAVRAMAKTCAAKGVRFVHISTDYVFDGRSRRPYTEDDPIGPLNVYGATKAMGESMARAAHDDVLIFRVASLFGVAGASGKGGNFVETMIRLGREKGRLRVIGDQWMSPTSTADAAWAILEAVSRRLPAATYHAVNSGHASWYEFAARIIERSGVEAVVEPIPATAYPLPAQRPAFSVLDNSRLASLIGPIPHWTEGLDRYLREKGHTAHRSGPAPKPS
jgi:dTDP-4-dehydrorhamnose reductase